MERVLLPRCRGPSHRVSRIPIPICVQRLAIRFRYDETVYNIYMCNSDKIRGYFGMCIHIIYKCCIQACHLLASPVRLCCCRVNRVRAYPQNYYGKN